MNDNRVNHPSHYTWLKELCGVEVTDWPRSHACIRETITTIEQLNQLLNLMHMEAV